MENSKPEKPNIPQEAVIVFRLKEVPPLDGVSLTSARAGETKDIQYIRAAAITSEHEMFHSLMDWIGRNILSKILQGADSTYRLLIVFRESSEADVFVNEAWGTLFFLNAHKKLAPMKPLHVDDLVLMHRICLPNKVAENEGLIAVMKVGWKFFMLFDFARKTGEGVSNLDFEKQLSLQYRRLAFENVHTLEHNETLMKRMFADGWFPFLEIIGREFDYIVQHYQNFDVPFTGEDAKHVVEAFTEERIRTMQEAWDKSRLINERKGLLDPAINLFLRGDDDSIKCCVNTLYSQIDGMLLLLQFYEVGGPKRELLSQSNRIETLTNVTEQKYDAEDVTLVPHLFGTYLQQYFFKDFNLDTGHIPQASHGVRHGVSRAEEHTKENALKLILIVNQIAWGTPKNCRIRAKTCS